MTYIYTMDSHDCYGTFTSEQQAHDFALTRGFQCYLLTSKPTWDMIEVYPTTKEHNHGISNDNR